MVSWSQNQTFNHGGNKKMSADYKVIKDSQGRDHQIFIYDQMVNIPNSVETGCTRARSLKAAISYCQRMMRYHPDAGSEFHIVPWESSFDQKIRWTVYFG
jgi:hypothetical protein